MTHLIQLIHIFFTKKVEIYKYKIKFMLQVYYSTNSNKEYLYFSQKKL